MRQKAWEEKHHLSLFRKKTGVNARSDDDLIVADQTDDQLPQQDTLQLSIDSPPHGLSPSYSRRPSIAGVQRRPSGVGTGYQPPVNRHDRYRRRRSASPMDPRDSIYRRISRAYDDDQEPLIGAYGYDERAQSPTIFGVDNDLLDITPVPFSRRQSFSTERQRSPRLSLATSPREHTSFFAETDPIPYLRQMSQQYSQERRLSQTFPEGRPLTLRPDKDKDQDDVDSVTSDDRPPETRF